VLTPTLPPEQGILFMKVSGDSTPTRNEHIRLLTDSIFIYVAEIFCSYVNYTFVLAISPSDDDRLDRLAETVLPVTIPTDATVALTHNFTSEQFDEIAAELNYQNATIKDVDAVLERYQSVRHLEGTCDDHNIDYEVCGVIGNISNGI